jgi:single-strand DNA-binding protein
MNISIFTGRTTKDIELRYTNDNTAVGSFSLAVDHGYGDNKKTSFFNCVAFKNTAESMEKHVKKGTKLIIQAEAQQNEYTDRDGNKRSSINFVVRNWEFAESKASSNNAPEQPAASPHGPAKDGFMDFANMVDDLPFD